MAYILIACIPIVCKFSVEQECPSNACLGRTGGECHGIAHWICELMQKEDRCETLLQELVENGVDVVFLAEFLKLHL